MAWGNSDADILAVTRGNAVLPGPGSSDFW